MQFTAVDSTAGTVAKKFPPCMYCCSGGLAHLGLQLLVLLPEQTALLVGQLEVSLQPGLNRLKPGILVWRKEKEKEVVKKTKRPVCPGKLEAGRKVLYKNYSVPGSRCLGLPALLKGNREKVDTTQATNPARHLETRSVAAATK